MKWTVIFSDETTRIAIGADIGTIVNQLKDWGYTLSAL